MKKLALLAALAIMGSTAWAQVVSIVQLNNFDPDRPIFSQSAGTLATPAQNVTIQLLGGPVGGTLAPVATQQGANTFTLLADGYFDGGIGIVPGVTGTGPASFEFRAWTGGGTYESALNVATVRWDQPVTQWDSTPPNLPPATIAALALPSSPTITVVPEPSTIALGLLGAAALLIRRRK
jgi:hypothetical protein